MIAGNVAYYDSSGDEQVPKEIKKVIGNKNKITNIYRIQASGSIMCRYICIGFIEFMLIKRKSFLDYINLFSPNEYENNNKIILNISNN